MFDFPFMTILVFILFIIVYNMVNSTYNSPIDKPPTNIIQNQPWHHKRKKN